MNAAPDSPGRPNAETEDDRAARRQADSAAITAVRAGDTARFEELIERHSPRLFGLTRKYVRREADVADLVQEVWIRAFRRLDSWRGDAPFEHWLTRLAVNVCYDHLRGEQRRKESPLTDLTDDEAAWLEHHPAAPEGGTDASTAARSLVQRLLAQLSPASRLVIQMLEIEDRSVKEISAVTGWSTPLVKVRAFRARAELRKIVATLDVRKYL